MYSSGVADAEAMGEDYVLDVVHGVVGETGGVDVFMLEDLQTLPHPFHAGGGDAGTERHGDAIVGEERAEPRQGSSAWLVTSISNAPGCCRSRVSGFFLRESTSIMV